MLNITELEKQLFEMQDLKYRDFHSRLMPGIDKETIIGIRTPILRKFTKEFARTPESVSSFV
jgi:3-methyladenine DNA glycosylase AlkD